MTIDKMRSLVTTMMAKLEKERELERIKLDKESEIEFI